MPINSRSSTVYKTKKCKWEGLMGKDEWCILYMPTRREQMTMGSHFHGQLNVPHNIRDWGADRKFTVKKKPSFLQCGIKTLPIETVDKRSTGPCFKILEFELPVTECEGL
jgi:hypothetical protein